MIKLSQEFGAHAGRQLSFDQDAVRLGRAPECDVVFDANIDLDASGRHCEIVKEASGFAVLDLGSRNGTYVNNQRITQKHTLKTGDTIECGRGGPRIRVTFDSPVAKTGMAGSYGPAGPFSGGAPVAKVAAFGAPSSPPTPPSSAPPPAAAAIKGGTVAVPLSELPGAGGSGAFAAGSPPPSAPSPAPSSGPSPAPGWVAPPSGGGSGGIGKKTMGLMIDQAIQQHSRKTRGLKILVGLLLLVVLAAGGAIGWLYYNGDLDDVTHARVRTPAVSDPTNAGARIAEANSANLYLLALVAPGQNVARGFCTGFAVSERLVATNAHCVHRANTEVRRGARLLLLRNRAAGVQIAATPRYADARFQNAQYSRGGSGYDVGLVEATTALPGWVRLAPQRELEALREGDGVFVYGFPGLTMNEASPVATITLGLVNRVTDFFDNAAAGAQSMKFLHSAQTSGGSSGSPIFLPTGAVIGLNAGSLADEETQIVTDPTNGQRREVEVNRGSNFKYGMRADLIRQAAAALNVQLP